MSAHIPRETDQHDERPAPGVSRRDMLLAGTALAASTLSGASALAQAQQAQPPQAQPAGRLPNVLAIMSDDIGWFDVGAYIVA